MDFEYFKFKNELNDKFKFRAKLHYVDQLKINISQSDLYVIKYMHRFMEICDF